MVAGLLLLALVLLALVLLSAGSLAAPAGAAKKPKRADLAVGSAAARLADGRLTVAVTARNLGRRSAGASTGAVSWKPAGSKGKAVLLKRFPLLAVANGGRRKLAVTVDVPAGTAAGRFAVSVCLDIRARVRESNGRNNCRAAGTVTVPAANVSPVAVVSPPPVAAPSLPGAVPPATTPPAGGGTPPPGGGTTPPPPGDTTPPDTAITQGPVGLIKERTASIWFTATEGGSTFSCRLDDAQWAPCPPIVNLSAIPDGTHTFEVRAVDAAGNADPTPASRTWSVDGTPPQTTITAGPLGAVNTTSGAPVFTASEESPYFECRVGGAAWAGCSSPHQLELPGEGSYTFSVRAYDVAGNVDATPASRTWTVDLTAPNTTLSGGPSGAVATADATFTLASSASDQAGFECRLDGGGWAPCTSPHQLTGLADGQHTFETRTIDGAGNRDASPEARTWTIDTTAPDTSILTGPSGTVASASAGFTFTSPEQGATFECRVDAGSWSTCSSPRNLAGLTDGAHTFDVRALDALGNPDATPASRTWTVDTTAPDTSITDGPSGAVASASATFEFSSGDATATFQCRLDAGAWGACSSPRQLTGLADGSHTFEVRAVDPVGNTDATPASRTWTVDTTAPNTSISTGPNGIVNSASATFTFTSPEPNATFQCRLDAGTWSACTSPHQLTGLADGSHTFDVRALDALGNPDASPASRTWTVDTTAPDTAITGGPQGTVASSSATFGFSSAATDVVAFECRIDAGAWVTCTSPRQLAGLADGSHTFDVRAIDAAGNVEGSPATRTWTVDTTAPDTAITSGPAGPVSSTSAAFAFTSADATAAFQCRLDGGAWAACVSPRELSGLADGSHTFEVRAVDPVGNTDQTAASRTWTIDTVAPNTAITAGPSGTVSNTGASFTFTSSEASSTFQCRVDGGTFAACSSPHELTSLADGSHTFEVRATDAAGNVDASAASRTWTVDTTAPDTTISGGPSGAVPSTSAAFAFSSPDPAATFQCRLDGGSWAACSSPHQLAGLGQGSHTFDVRALDAAGNTDASPASRTWTVDTTAPDTTITSGPEPTSSSPDAAFAFSSADADVAGFECSLDSGAFSTCSSPRQLTALADGEHSFRVRATDAAGNVETTPATWSWTVAAAQP